MNYYKSETAGHYGKGGWCVYTRDCFGYVMVTKVFASEEEAQQYTGKAKEVRP